MESQEADPRDGMCMCSSVFIPPQPLVSPHQPLVTHDSRRLWNLRQPGRPYVSASPTLPWQVDPHKDSARRWEIHSQFQRGGRTRRNNHNLKKKTPRKLLPQVSKSFSINAVRALWGLSRKSVMRANADVIIVLNGCLTR